ncbi:MAG: hypothetical protein U5L06_09770 [Rhodovibrio sp.]|nr:hypothetical protein [Rhodovibrio sp.]
MSTRDLTHNFLKMEEHSIAYLEAGEGPPFVLLYGIPTSSLLWRDGLFYNKTSPASRLPAAAGGWLDPVTPISKHGAGVGPLSRTRGARSFAGKRAGISGDCQV